MFLITALSLQSVIPSDPSDSTPSRSSSSPSWSGQSPSTSTTRSLSHTSASGSAPPLRMSLASLTPFASSPPAPKSDGPVLTPNIEHPAPFPHPLAPNFGHFERVRQRSGSIASSTVTRAEDYGIGSYGEHTPNFDSSAVNALHMQAFSNPYASNVNLASPVNAEFSNLSLGGTHSPPGLADIDHGIGSDIFKFEEPPRRLSQQSDQLLYPLSGASPKLDQDAFDGSMYPHFSSSGALLQENNGEHS